MNQIGLRFRDPAPAHGADKVIDLDGLLSAARRQKAPMIVSVAIAVALGLAYLATTPKSYTAHATVLADQNANRIVAEISALDEPIQDDTALLTEVEVIRSKAVALDVARQLDLPSNEGFQNPPVSMARRLVSGAKGAIKTLIPSAPAPELPPLSDNAALNSAAGILQRDVHATRIGRSTALLISYTTHDPQLSADIANAYAQAYMDDQLKASFDSTERTTVWLQSRLAELEANSRAAAEAVERFRSQNGLSSADGRPVTEQRLSQLNTELAGAVADTARAAALTEEFQKVLDDAGDEELHRRVMALDAEPDSRLAGMQERIAALAGRLAQLEAERGQDNAEVQRARVGLQEQAQSAFSEIARLAEKYSGEEAAARAREDALRRSVDEATAANDRASELRVQLRSLEQRANAVATLYQNSLTRFEAIDQQKSFPVSSIRILSAADAPRFASGPSTTKTLALAIILGLLAGTGIGTVREFRDRFVRTGSALSSETGLPFLGYLPDLSNFGQPNMLERLLKPASGAMVHSTEHPKSLYSETLRSIRLAVEAGLPPDRRPLIGIASALPGEGKTTLSLNLAALIAASGRTVLLIDGDLRHPGLTRLAEVNEGPGLVEALTGPEGWRMSRLELGSKRLHFIPAVATDRVAHTSDLLASDAMGRLLSDAREIYDYVIVDLPPIGPVVDARAMLRHLNRMVLVAEWGRTPKGLIGRLLEDDPAISEKAVGTVLNKVDIEALDRYGPASGAERYRGADARYYHVG